MASPLKNDIYTELFNTNNDFRDYVEKYIFKHHVTLAEALSHYLVREYGDYILKGEQPNGCEEKRGTEYGEDKSC